MQHLVSAKRRRAANSEQSLLRRAAHSSNSARLWADTQLQHIPYNTKETLIRTSLIPLTIVLDMRVDSFKIRIN